MHVSNDVNISARTAAAEANINTNKFDTVMLFAVGLAGAETVTVYVNVGGAELAVYDAAGDAVVLTPTNPSVVLEGGPQYHVEKSSTVGQASVHTILRRTSPSN